MFESFFCCRGICGATLWVEVELNREMNEIKDIASSAETTIDSVSNLVSKFSTLVILIRTFCQANGYSHDEVQEVIRNISDNDNFTASSQPQLSQLNITTLPLQYLYSNISGIAQGYFLDESADDVEDFELPRFGDISIYAYAVCCIIICLFL